MQRKLLASFMEAYIVPLVEPLQLNSRGTLFPTIKALKRPPKKTKKYKRLLTSVDPF